MTILDHPIISERYFFPRRDVVDDPFWVDVDGARLSCFYPERDRENLCIYFHGNGETAADYVGYEAWFAEMEFDLLVAEYRGYGASTGSPMMESMLDDVADIVNASGKSPESVVFFGRSVGSLYAIEAASKFPNAKGLILESGIADVGERILLRASCEELGTDRESFDQAIAARFEHQMKLRAFDGPVLILHAANDHLVSVTHADKNAAAIDAEKLQKVIFDFGDHNSIFAANRDQYMEAVSTFMRRASF